jgi:MATE family multidrug resistance protein
MAEQAVIPGDRRRRRELGEMITLAWPVVLSRLGIMTMGVADAVVVGRYSAAELGYQALGWAPTAIFMMTGVGLLAGTQIMTARHLGEGRPEATGGVFRRGAVYGLWIGLLGGAILWAFGPWMMGRAGLAPDLAEGSGRVLRILALSMPLHMLGTAAIFYLEALSRPRPAMIAMLVCNVVNLATDIVLVGGVGPIPALGAAGASWATVGSRGLLAVILVAYIFRMADARGLGLFAKPIDGPKAGADQRRVGYGGGASYFVEAGAFAGMNFIAGWLGGLAVAGWAIVLNVTAVIFMVPLGLSAATAVLVGRAYGAKDGAGVIRAGNLGYGLTCAVALAVSVGVLLTAPAIAGFYATDPALIALAAGALMLACLYFVFDGLQVVAAQALRARGDVLMPTITHVISYALVMMPLGWALAHRVGLGLNGIVWAVIVASALSAGLLLGRFWQLGRRI